MFLQYVAICKACQRVVSLHYHALRIFIILLTKSPFVGTGDVGTLLNITPICSVQIFFFTYKFIEHVEGLLNEVP